MYKNKTINGEWQSFEVPISFIKSTFGPYLLSNYVQKDNSKLITTLNNFWNGKNISSHAPREYVSLDSTLGDSKEFFEKQEELKIAGLYVNGENFQDDNNQKVQLLF